MVADRAGVTFVGCCGRWDRGGHRREERPLSALHGGMEARCTPLHSDDPRSDRDVRTVPAADGHTLGEGVRVVAAAGGRALGAAGHSPLCLSASLDSAVRPSHFPLPLVLIDERRVTPPFKRHWRTGRWPQLRPYPRCRRRRQDEAIVSRANL